MKVIGKFMFWTCLILVQAAVFPAFSASGEVYKLAKGNSEAKKPLPEGIKACRRDINRFCKKVKPGDGRVGKCLFANLHALTKRCKTYAAHGGEGHELESLTELDKLMPQPPAVK